MTEKILKNYFYPSGSGSKYSWMRTWIRIRITLRYTIVTLFCSPRSRTRTVYFALQDADRHGNDPDPQDELYNSLFFYYFYKKVQPDYLTLTHSLSRYWGMSLAMASAVAGDSSEGLIITQLPAASAPA